MLGVDIIDSYYPYRVYLNTSIEDTAVAMMQF